MDTTDNVFKTSNVICNGQCKTCQNYSSNTDTCILGKDVHRNLDYSKCEDYLIREQLVHY